MTTLKNIQLNNFLSHANTSIDFHEGQKLLIDGKSGSGKSGIVEGLIWCFYGRSRVENNRNLIKHGKSNASVEVTLADGETIYKIIRSITKNGRHTIALEKDGQPVATAGIRGSQEYIERDILKSSYLLFINSIAYPQDNIENFVKQPADRRKDIILEIINAAAYDRYYDKTKEEIRSRQTKTAVSTEKVQFLKGQLSQAEEDAEGLSAAVGALKLADQRAGETVEELFEVQTALVSLKSKAEAIESLRLVNNGFQDSIGMFQEHNQTAIEKMEEIKSIDLGELKKKVDTIPGLEKQLEELVALEDKSSRWAEAYGKLIQEAPVLIDYSRQINELKTRMIRIVNEEIYDCPELKKVCPVLKEKNDARAKEMEGDIQRLEYNSDLQEERKVEHTKKLEALGPRPMTDRDALTSIRYELNRLYQAKNEYEKNQDKIASLAEIQKLIDDNNLQIAQYTDRINDNNTKIKSAEGMLGGLEEYERKQTFLRNALSGFENEVNALRSDIAQIETNKRKAEELRNMIKQVEVDSKDALSELELLELLKEAFGPRGIKAMVVDHVIPQLENKINDILSKLSDFTVKLDTQKSGVKGDTVLEGLFITIINELGDEFDYNNYSGGEKLKITVAITEALAEIQKLSFRILDELFMSLDEDSTQSFAEVMNTLNSRFSQMICITHLRDIKEMFPEKITMVKVNGTSRVI